MRLKRLKIRNFAAFPEADLTFAKGLNVFVGENGTGKTLLMRLPYAVMRLLADLSRVGELPAKSVLQHRIADKIVGVARPEYLGRLARRRQGRQRCEVSLWLAGKAGAARPVVWRGRERIRFNFATQSKAAVTLEGPPPSRRHRQPRPIYLPPKELLTIYPGFVALYDMYKTEFDGTWRDTCQLLGEPVLWGAGNDQIVQLLEGAMGGRLERDRNEDRFYLRDVGSGRMEAPLMAEGARKLGMLAHLAASGALKIGGCVFWDEPEANLNPALIRRVARVVLDLCARDMQIFVATHSLFLLRELELLCAANDVEHRYFAFAKEENDVAVRQATVWEDLDPLMLLDEELAQSDRYLAMGEPQ